MCTNLTPKAKHELEKCIDFQCQKGRIQTRIRIQKRRARNADLDPDLDPARSGGLDPQNCPFPQTIDPEREVEVALMTRGIE